MNRLKLEHLSIRTFTNDGLYGLDIPFSDGLNVMHAENTHGKSTCIQAIVYALGLEGCLGPSRKVPLKTALTSNLRKSDGSKALIIESKIYLQISNDEEKSITLMRSSNYDRKDLISIYEGNIKDVLDKSVKAEDYFVRFEGSAQRERGFHFYLSNFLNIVQPNVIKFDGSSSLLYLESIFSVNYVEQTRGWGGILNILPTYLGIRDLSQRIIEHTLALDVQDFAKRKQKHLNKKKDSEILWLSNIDKIEALSKEVKCQVSNNLPEKITTKTNLTDNSYLYRKSESGELLNLKSILVIQSEKLEKLKELKVNISGINPQKIKILEENLSFNLTLLSEQENAIGILVRDLDVSEEYVKSISIRVSDIRESLRKYKDLKRLEEIGSEEGFSIVKNKCPTCDAKLKDSLLSKVENAQSKILSIDGNIKYLDKQKSTFDVLLQSEIIKSKLKHQRFNEADEKVRETRSIIRSIKDSLVDSALSPSRDLIKRELLLELEIEKIERSLSLEGDIISALVNVLNNWKIADSALKALPHDGFSFSDNKKIRKLKEKFNEYLEQFGYSSTDIDEFGISKRTYMPSLNDIDISSEASASDNIRVIWSYLLTLLTLDQFDVGDTNHLGLLILDEPRQQEAKSESFAAFIKAISGINKMKKQVIIGTSEEYSELSKILSPLEANFIHFDSEMITKL